MEFAKYLLSTTKRASLVSSIFRFHLIPEHTKKFHSTFYQNYLQSICISNSIRNDKNKTKVYTTHLPKLDGYQKHIAPYACIQPYCLLSVTKYRASLGNFLGIPHCRCHSSIIVRCWELFYQYQHFFQQFFHIVFCLFSLASFINTLFNLLCNNGFVVKAIEGSVLRVECVNAF